MATNQGWEKWYWRDWKSDPAVRRLTAPSRAIWFEILGDMWLQETDTWTGCMLDLEQAANATSEDVEAFLQEVEETGLCDKNEHVTNCRKHVTLVSRRKHKEQKARENAKLRQRRLRAKRAGHAPSQGESESESESEKNIHPNGCTSSAPEAAPTTPTPQCPHQAIVELYHQHCPTLPRVRVLTENRKRCTRQRWREILEGREPPEALAWFGAFFERVNRSDFLTGQIANGQRRPFTADFEWLMRPTNFVKVFEGRYDG